MLRTRLRRARLYRAGAVENRLPVGAGPRARDDAFVERLGARARVFGRNGQLVERFRVQPALDVGPAELQPRGRVARHLPQTLPVALDLILVLQRLKDRVIQERLDELDEERGRLASPHDFERMQATHELLRQQGSKRQRHAKGERQQAASIPRRDAREARPRGLGDFLDHAALTGAGQRRVPQDAGRAVGEVRRGPVDVIGTVDGGADRVVARCDAVDRAQPCLCGVEGPAE